jgi:glycine cleavage system H protein
MPASERHPPALDGATCAIGADLWFRREADGTYVVGLSDAAQRRAGPLAHYRGPIAGRTYRAGEPALSLESAKWVGHLGLPVDGSVVASNAQAESDPTTINRDPYGVGWLYRMRPKEPGRLETLAGRPG